MNTQHPTPSPTCLNIASLLPVLDEPESDQQAVEAARVHIQTCAYCQAHLEQYAQLTDALQARFTKPLLAQSYTEEIMRTITQRDQISAHPVDPTHTAPTRRPSFTSGIVTVAAAILIAVFAQVLFSAHHGNAGSSHPVIVSLPQTKGYFTGVSMISPTDGWATGFFTQTSNGTVPSNTVVLYHYHGAVWSPIAVPVQFQLNQGYFSSGISMDAAADGWVVGSNDRDEGYVLHYTHGAWQALPSPAIHDIILRVQAFSATSLWIATLSNTIYHFDGMHWTTSTLSNAIAPNQITQTLGFQMVSPTEGWAAVGGTLGNTYGSFFLHYKQGSWAIQGNMVPHVAIGAVTMLSTEEGWAFGNESVSDGNGNTYRVPLKQHMYHYQNGQWQESSLPLTMQENIALTSLGIASSGDAWVVGQDNSTIFGQTTSNFRSNTALLHWNGTQWQSASAPLSGATNDSIVAMSFADANNGWGVGYIANIASSSVISDSDVLTQAVPLIWHFQNGVWTIFQ